MKTEIFPESLRAVASHALYSLLSCDDNGMNLLGAFTAGQAAIQLRGCASSWQREFDL